MKRLTLPGTDQLDVIPVVEGWLVQSTREITNKCRATCHRYHRKIGNTHQDLQPSLKLMGSPPEITLKNQINQAILLYHPLWIQIIEQLFLCGNKNILSDCLLSLLTRRLRWFHHAPVFQLGHLFEKWLKYFQH